jgi:uncharacterized glyoxalase superfamily protein PhnB
VAEQSIICPSLRYRDAPAAVDWLTRAFGLTRGEVVENPDGTLAHAELRLGDGWVFLGSEKPPTEDPNAPRAGQGWVYVGLDGVDAVFAQSTDAGAEVVVELHDTDYGSREFAVRDLEGNLWTFGTYHPASG